MPAEAEVEMTAPPPPEGDAPPPPPPEGSSAADEPAPPPEPSEDVPPPPPKRPKPDYYYTDLRPYKRTRASRWAAEDVKAFIPGFPKYIPYDLDKESFDALLLRLRIEELTHRIIHNQLGINPDPEARSPSPPPEYDKDGKPTVC